MCKNKLRLPRCLTKIFSFQEGIFNRSYAHWQGLATRLCQTFIGKCLYLFKFWNIFPQIIKYIFFKLLNSFVQIVKYIYQKYNRYVHWQSPAIRLSETFIEKCLYLFKFWNIFSQIVKCIFPNCKVYFFKLWNIFNKVVIVTSTGKAQLSGSDRK